METLTSESQIVRQYMGFVDQLGRRLRDHPYGVAGTALGSIGERLPGLEQLFDSLVAASPTAKKTADRFVEDWNPFSQRVLLSDETPPETSAFERDFSLLATYAQTLVEWGHEAVHVLAVEPFLCGRRSIASEAEFIQWNLASEGLAFWYADIVITRTIRSFIPEAELIYNRQSVSNTCFHPEQAFRRLGLNDPKTLLPVYIGAFLGTDRALESGDDPFTRTLCRRLRNFYAGTTKTLSSLYTVLESFRFFEDFVPRFFLCEGLPSLLNDEVLDSQEPLDRFLLRMGTEFLPALADLAPEQIRRVAVRRHIQTRAYYAWSMNQAFEQRWVFGNAQLDSQGACLGFASYLDGLEKTLKTFAANGDSGEALGELQSLDRFYENEIRERLDRGDAYVRYRYRLYPYFAPTGGIVGMADNRSNYTTAEMEEVIRFVMKGCGWDRDLIAALHAFLAADSGSEAREAFNRLMAHPDMLQAWSVRLSSVNPLENRYREPLFEYT